MEVQKEGEEEEDKWKERQNKGQEEEEERAERSTDSTIHTIPELLLLDAQQVSLFSSLLFLRCSDFFKVVHYSFLCVCA